MKIGRDVINDISVVIMDNEWLTVTIAPSLGGKILSVFNKELSREFLWKNDALTLTKLSPGSDYDSNFFGGIDELIPNDIPQTVDANEYPDHGELWTMPLECIIENDAIRLRGILPISQLEYEKSVRLNDTMPSVVFDYKITNRSGKSRNFLWKLHAAVAIEAGDKLETHMTLAKVADAGYSRFSNTNQFAWPQIESVDASIIPGRNDSMDFFYLYNSSIGRMHLSSKNGRDLFGYDYDSKVFPFQWYFASYGGFLGHYVSILEPCSAMPINLLEAISNNQCTSLNPGQVLDTQVTLFAGPAHRYLINNEKT